MTPFLSVITPVYNGEKFLNDYFLSLVDQKYKHFEVILVDDGSSDNSCKIIDYFRNQSNLNIHLKRQKNSGISLATKVGLSMASSPYLVLMDQDDIAREDRLLRIASGFKEGAELIMSSYELMNHEGRLTGKVIKVPEFITEDNILAETLKRNYFLGSAMAFVFKGDFSLDADSGGVTDFDVALKMLFRGYSYHYINEVLLYYRVHSGNYSANYKITKKSAIDVLRKYDIEEVFGSLLKRGLSPFEAYGAVGIMCMYLGDFDRAHRYLYSKALGEKQTSGRVYLEIIFYLSVYFYKVDDWENCSQYLKMYLDVATVVNPSVANNLGVLEVYNGNLKAGYNWFKLACDAQSDYMDAKDNLRHSERGLFDRNKYIFTERLLRENIVHVDNIVRS